MTDKYMQIYGDDFDHDEEKVRVVMRNKTVAPELNAEKSNGSAEENRQSKSFDVKRLSSFIKNFMDKRTPSSENLKSKKSSEFGSREMSSSTPTGLNSTVYIKQEDPLDIDDVIKHEKKTKNSSVKNAKKYISEKCVDFGKRTLNFLKSSKSKLMPDKGIKIKEEKFDDEEFVKEKTTSNLSLTESIQNSINSWIMKEESGFTQQPTEYSGHQSNDTFVASWSCDNLSKTYEIPHSSKSFDVLSATATTQINYDDNLLPESPSRFFRSTALSRSSSHIPGITKVLYQKASQRDAKQIKNEERPFKHYSSPENLKEIVNDRKVIVKESNPIVCKYCKREYYPGPRYDNHSCKTIRKKKFPSK